MIPDLLKVAVGLALMVLVGWLMVLVRWLTLKWIGAI